MENIDRLVLELCKQPVETEWLEFKRNNCDPQMIGEDISALSNSALLADRSYAYMVFGIDDTSHDIVGTHVHLKNEKKGNQELENWLRYMLSKNAEFEFKSTNIDGANIELIVIAKAQGLPVSFEKVDYIRSGSYTKKLTEFPMLRTQMWDKLRNERFENVLAKTDLTIREVSKYLDCDTYFNLLHIPIPEDDSTYIHYFIEDGLIVRQDDGMYAITNLGAILLAKHLYDFNRLSRKALRIVQYEDTRRLSIRKEEEIDAGYAISLEMAVKYVDALLPSKEDINEIRRTTKSKFPLPAIRETIANSLIHQDFYVTGAGPIVELFTNRVEVTNPGVPLIDIMRIVDNPPRSRNERLAAMMRRMGMCEELGRGWDRMVISCESQLLPAPHIQIYPESTKVSLFSYQEYANIPMEDKLWSAYLHACIRYTEGTALTNSSLRERFGLKLTSSGSISRLIKAAMDNNYIKCIDPTTAPRYMKYVPIWG